ncbi:TOMM precursor leader peptide-binding protein [Streptomyces sp. NBC_00334]|uniref:TOMM precursor leader peptide-binding protein n=1 Tax=Streptomyces sp. NBC_00334 TaxID=2975713 RepID=UPI002E29C4ED|nr:TOMM precursor leader peptide-binding protein [Streptomyces sp. NBC_00334]
MNGALIGFRRHLRAEVVPDDATYLISEHGITAIRAPHLEAVAPLLDGSRDLPALLRDSPEALSAERLTELLTQLADAGFIEYREHLCSEPADPSAEAYWELAGLEGQRTCRRTAATAVELRVVGDLDVGHAVRALSHSGLAVATGPAPEAALTLVVCDDYLAPELAGIDAEHRASGRPWLLAKPSGATVWVGPVLRPGAGACWSCLSHPIRRHRGVESQVGAALGRPGPVPGPVAGISCTVGAGLHMAALEAVKWLAGYQSGQDRLITFDTLTLDSRHHAVRRRPQCRECGDPGLNTERVLAPVVPRSRPKAPGGNGGHRSRPAQQMLDTYRHLVSPVTGVVTGITRVQGGPAFLNSFSSGPNPVSGGPGLTGLLGGLRQINGGKGVTALDAEVSALCEAVERYSGCLLGEEYRVRGRYRDLDGLAVHPDACQLFADDQFDDRDAWNAAHSGLHHVPERFDEDAEVDWTPVWSLTGRRHVLLPTAQLYFATAAERRHPVAGRRFVHADSNGNAAGSSTEDAILQGFLELVERDAVALWWYNRVRRPGVDLHAAADPWTEELIEVHRGLGRQVWALDLTSDLGIPVFAALSRRTDKAAEDIVFGFGAHLDARTALRRALTELNQLLPAVVGARPDGGGYGLDDPELTRWWRGATLGNQPYLRPLPPRAGPLAELSFPTAPDLRDDLDAVTALMRERGLDLLVLDQTRPDVELPVVKVVVPGLRSFWARFAPGRLYDVPVALGWRPEPVARADLNPVPLFV